MTHVPHEAGALLPGQVAAGGTIMLPLPKLAGGARARKAPARGAAEGQDALALDQISTLLWAGTAFRQHRHGRAALPQRMRPVVALYAVLPEGTYRYDPAEHSLVRVTARDLRRWIAPQGGMRSALDLLYVDDGAPEDEAGWEECGTVAGAGAAQIAQNIGAHCACSGLVASVARHAAPQLMAALGLAPPYRLVLVQRIGYPSAGPH